MARYEIRSLGELSWFLGIRVVRDRAAKKVWLCQDSYIDKITTRFHLEHHKPPHTPLPPDELQPYEGQATAQNGCEIKGNGKVGRKAGSCVQAVQSSTEAS